MEEVTTGPSGVGISFAADNTGALRVHVLRPDAQRSGVCVCVRLCCTCVFSYMYICIYTYIYEYIYTYIHIYIYTYI